MIEMQNPNLMYRCNFCCCGCLLCQLSYPDLNSLKGYFKIDGVLRVDIFRAVL